MSSLPRTPFLTPADRQAAGVLLVSCLCLTLLYYPANRYWMLDWLQQSWPALGLSFRQQVVHNPDTDLYRAAYWALASIASYCLLPLLAIRLLDRRPLADFGLAWPDRAALKTDLKLFPLFYAVMLPLVWWASGQPGFLKIYPFSDLAPAKACGRTGCCGSCCTSPNSPRWNSSFAAIWCMGSSPGWASAPSS